MLKRIFNPLFLSISIVILSFLIFAPAKNITVDEKSYILNAQDLLNNNLKSPCTETPRDGKFPTGEYCISKYNIGTSLLIAPIVALNIDLIKFIPLVLFVLSIILFKKILENYVINEWWLGLFAFFPSFTYIHRTLLSETFSLFFVLLFWYSVIKGLKKKGFLWGILAGVSLGIGIWIRYSNVLIFGIFLAVLLFQNRRRIMEILPLFVSSFFISIPFAVSLAIFNTYMYGAPLRSGYYISGEETISLAFITINIWMYLLVLNVVYPGLLLNSLIKMRKYSLMLLPFWGLFLFYQITPNSLFQGEIVDFVTGIRFLIPVIPFTLVPYIKFLERINPKVVFIMLATISIGVSFLHFRFVAN